MKQRKYFGTDGVRGRVGTSYVNPEFILKLGWAVGRVLGQGQRKKIIIGKDTRVSGYMLESALEAGLAAAGMDVRLLGPMPTPGIAYLTQTLRAHAGIVISASHNLFEDNGIKFFDADGGKLPDALELAIEEEMDKPLSTVPSAELGKASRINDAAGRYIEFCKSSIPSLMRLNDIKVVVDCANGATYHIAPKVFAELGAEVITMAVQPDGFNINKDCGSTRPESLKQKVLEEKADLGIALDGDGDRVILIDANGNTVDGDKIIYIIAKDRHLRQVLDGGVVGTVMSNYGLEKAITALNLPFIRTQVGDRFVLEELKNREWKIGGEPCGHIICLDKTTTGDGIISALQVLACMIKYQKSLEELASSISLYPQTLVNIQTSDAHCLANQPQMIDLVKSVEEELKGEGRIVLRPSGTEPLLRVMIESLDETWIAQQTRRLDETLKQLSNPL